MIFSQDQDLSEAVRDVRLISDLQSRWIKMASAFPFSAKYENIYGINGTDCIRFGRNIYDACIDPIDYRPQDVFNPVLP